MTMIPDCRNDEDYNTDNLLDKDKEFVRGFDYCVGESVDNFFNNLDVYFDDDSHITHMLNEELPNSLKGEEEIEFTSGEKETRKINTYADLFRSKLLDWLEKERDELITSMIDAMGDLDGQGKEDNR